jgi:hypothetical protein
MPAGTRDNPSAILSIGKFRGCQGGIFRFTIASVRHRQRPGEALSLAKTAFETLPGVFWRGNDLMILTK